MLDIKFIRENVELIKEGLKNKKSDFDLDSFLNLNERRRQLSGEVDNLRSQQNNINDQVSFLIKEKKDPKEIIAQSKEISKNISTLDDELKEIRKNFQWQLLCIPNIAHQSVPAGGEADNKIIKTVGNLKKFNFEPLTHVELAEHLDIVDFKRAPKLAGSNFILFKGLGAKLERALINFMLDLHTTEHGYTEIAPPFVANTASMITTAQLPKLEEDMYRLKDEEHFLIPTAEVPVTNIHSGETLEEQSLPINYTAYTACFRKEAGSYGKDTKGLVRVHQFDKVELVKFTKPDDSYAELENLLVDACKVIDLLDIPYRTTLLATGEMSFAAAKCYDIEIYAPGMDRWLEVSSCSNFEDFQARRGNIRYRDKITGKSKFVHTLNGSGVALPRLVVAILENYQQKDGSVTIPEVLRKYFHGRTELTK
mgnify:CR=1 FL=1